MGLTKPCTPRDEDLVKQASLFCQAAHQAVGQKRKYTGEPYWHHPFEVAVTREESEPMNKEQIAQDALGISWYDTESMARRVAEHAASEINKLTQEIANLEANILRLESDLEEPAHMQADAYRQAVDKIHPYVEAGKLPSSLYGALGVLLGAFDRLEGLEK